MSVLHVLTLLFASAVLTQGCNLYGIRSCIESFKNKYPLATNAFSYHGHTLNQMCGDLKDAENCMRQYLSMCDENYKAIWEVFHGTMRYTCSEESKRILAENHDCTKLSGFVTRLKSCNSTMQSKLMSIRLYGGMDTGEQICSTVKEFSSCAIENMRDHCDNSLVKWYEGFLDAAFKPTEKLIHCNFHAGDLDAYKRVTPRSYNKLSMTVTPPNNGYIHHMESNGCGMTRYCSLLMTLAMILVCTCMWVY